MRLWNWLISVLLHVVVIALAVILPYLVPSSPKIDLNRQVMDLLLTSSPPAPGPIAPTDPVLETAGKAATQDSAPPVEVAPEPPKPEPPKPEPPKPEPPKPEQKKPEPPKPEQKKPEPPKPEEQQVSPNKKPEQKKPEQKKPEQKKPEPSKQDIINAALKDAKKEAGKSQKATESEQQVLERELAELRKNVDGPPGQAGGLGGRGVGGTGGSGAATLSDIYSQQVGAIIKRNWRYPAPATKDNVVCQVEIIIAPSGEITNFNLVRPSGRTDFDGSTLKAVATTKTLPPPPSKAETRITISFNLQELSH